MNQDITLSTFFGKQSYILPETAIVRDYVQYLVATNYGDENHLLSETLVFGIGCGMAFQFRKTNSQQFYLSTVNEILLKDFLANINITMASKEIIISAGLLCAVNFNAIIAFIEKYLLF